MCAPCPLHRCFLFPTVLGLKKLLDVLTELLEVSADWYNIGLALNMSSGTLDAMEGPYKRPRDCLRDMLKEWLSTSLDPSWEGLIAALRHPVVGKETLARQLEAKHCTQAPPEGRYRVLPGKRPWALAVQRQKSEGGHLRELPGVYQGTFMR